MFFSLLIKNAEIDKRLPIVGKISSILLKVKAENPAAKTTKKTFQNLLLANLRFSPRSIITLLIMPIMLEVQLIKSP